MIDIAYSDSMLIGGKHITAVSRRSISESMPSQSTDTRTISVSSPLVIVHNFNNELYHLNVRQNIALFTCNGMLELGKWNILSCTVSASCEALPEQAACLDRYVIKAV